LVGGTLLAGSAAADDGRQEACKKAMNDRIQVCTDACTARALAAASDYKDTNNNVKFGCLKGCAVGQILQMKACREGRPLDSTETNR
jgi:hypothetical protein